MFNTYIGQTPGEAYWIWSALKGQARILSDPLLWKIGLVLFVAGFIWALGRSIVTQEPFSFMFWFATTAIYITMGLGLKTTAPVGIWDTAKGFAGSTKIQNATAEDKEYIPAGVGNVKGVSWLYKVIYHCGHLF